MELLNQYFDGVDEMEPNSNSEMPFINAERQAAAAKLEAEKKAKSGKKKKAVEGGESKEEEESK